MYIVLNNLQYGPDVEDAAKAVNKLVAHWTARGDVRSEAVSAAIAENCDMGDETGDDEIPDPLLRNAVDELLTVSLCLCVLLRHTLSLAPRAPLARVSHIPDSFVFFAAPCASNDAW